MIRLAAKPLIGPLSVSLAAASEVPLWTPATFTPLQKQKLGKVWRVNMLGITNGSGSSDDGVLNFYYGSAISAAALLGFYSLNFNGGVALPTPFNVWIQDNGLVAVGGDITPSAVQVPANLSQDSALLVTGFPNAAVAGGALTINLLTVEELNAEEEIPELYQRVR